MRVALVIEKFRSGPGGVEAAAWGAAHALARSGEEVHVVAREAEASGAVRVHRVRVPTAWQPARVLAFSWAARRACARIAPDVVQSFARTLHQDVYRAGGGSHADYLVRRYDGLARGLRRLSPRHAVLLAIEERIFRRSRQSVLCNSAMVRDEIARRYGVGDERLAVIPNGVELARFEPEPRRGEADALRAAAGAAGEPVWLFVGSGFARKGLDTALRALAAGGPKDAQLWVAGRDDPAPFARLAARLGIAKRVRFLGERSDVPALCAAADALLLPTRYDAFANACLEAAAAGLPVVTSGANGAAAVLGAGAIVVADPEDAAGFARALGALGDPAERARRGRAARAAAAQLDWDRHAERLRELYRRVVTARARPCP